MSVGINFITYSEVPNQQGDLFAKYIGLYYDGKLKSVVSNEPEEHTGYVNLNHIRDVMYDVYEKGVEDGRNKTNN